MRIQLWYTDNYFDRQLFSEPASMVEALVELRRCQMETGATDMRIDLIGAQEGDV